MFFYVLEKRADILRHQHWFSREMTSQERAHTDDMSLPRSGSDAYQYGISGRVSQSSFRGETSGSIAKCRLFSQTSSSSALWCLIFVVCFRAV